MPLPLPGPCPAVVAEAVDAGLGPRPHFRDPYCSVGEVVGAGLGFIQLPGPHPAWGGKGWMSGLVPSSSEAASCPGEGRIGC